MQLTTHYMQRTTYYIKLTTHCIQYRVLLRKEARLIKSPWGTSGLVHGMKRLVQGSATTPIITPRPQSGGVICLVDIDPTRQCPGFPDVGLYASVAATNNVCVYKHVTFLGTYINMI
jgi:hypothetical protein